MMFAAADGSRTGGLHGGQPDAAGRVPDRIWDDNLGLQPTGTLPFVPAQPSGLHYGQLPLDRTVVRFQQPGSV